MPKDNENLADALVKTLLSKKISEEERSKTLDMLQEFTGPDLWSFLYLLQSHLEGDLFLTERDRLKSELNSRKDFVRSVMEPSLN